MVGGKSKRENPMPVIDDGWWASVLAEENRFSPPAPRMADSKSAALPLGDTPIWFES